MAPPFLIVTYDLLGLVVGRALMRVCTFNLCVYVYIHMLTLRLNLY